MIDCEGASQPPDAHGNQYTLMYYCCLCHGVLLEPMLNLSAREVRRAFARCLFRSGTIPKCCDQIAAPSSPTTSCRSLSHSWGSGTDSAPLGGQLTRVAWNVCIKKCRKVWAF